MGDQGLFNLSWMDLQTGHPEDDPGFRSVRLMCVQLMELGNATAADTLEDPPVCPERPEQREKEAKGQDQLELHEVSSPPSLYPDE